MPNSRGLLPERLAARLWRNRRSRQALRTQDGRRLKVIYAGRPNGGPGPDFRDALLHWEGLRPLRGDVEIHREPAAWRQHGHHQDPRYNNVVLHVVLQPSRGPTALRQDGYAVPVVELGAVAGPFGKGEGEATSSTPSSPAQRWRGLSPDQLGRLLDQAGEARFIERSTRLQVELQAEDVEELLYRGILEALGYSQNRRPFLELAQRLPWHTLRPAALSLAQGSRPRAVRGWMLAAAGLLGGSGPGAPSSYLARMGAPFEHVTPLDPRAWCFAGVRPANRPDRRITGAAALLGEYLDAGLLEGFTPKVKATSLRGLGKALTVVQEGVTLIGRSRALDMGVNVVLPVMHAWGVAIGDPALARGCLGMYRRAPRLAENEITREMAALLGIAASSLGGGALRQQGLMHLYRLVLKDGLNPRGKVEGSKTFMERARVYRLNRSRGVDASGIIAPMAVVREAV